MTKEEAFDFINHIMFSSPHEATEQIVKRKYYAELLKDYIADTVEVVRCKDCIHYGSFNGETESCCSPCADSYFKVKPNDYCSRGERETE